MSVYTTPLARPPTGRYSIGSVSGTGVVASHLHSLRFHVGKGCPTRGPHAAPDVVLSGPRCNKFVSRLFKFLVFFVGSSIFAIKTQQNYTCCFCYGSMLSSSWLLNMKCFVILK